MDEYIIQGATLRRFGDQVRRLANAEGLNITLTPQEMIDFLQAIQRQNPQAKVITSNGRHDPDTGYNSFSYVEVNVPNTYTIADEGKIVKDGVLTVYTDEEEGKVVVNHQLVQQSALKRIYENGVFDTTSFKSVDVRVSNSYTDDDQGKVVSGSSLSPQSVMVITHNGTYDTTLKNSVTVAVEAGGNEIVCDTATLGSGEVLRCLPAKTSVTDNWGAFQYVKDDIVTLEMPALQRIDIDGGDAGSAWGEYPYKFDSVSLPVCTYISGISCWCHVKTLNAPLCQTILNCGNIDITNADFPACTTIGNEAFASCSSLVNAYFPVLSNVGYRAFDCCVSLETVEFPSSLNFSEDMFSSVLDSGRSTTFRMYLRGETMGICPIDVFGDYNNLPKTYISNADPHDIGSGCGSDFENYVIDHLEIYVPAALINDFKTTWADGVFANNIYPLPDEDENEETANSD